MVSTCKSRICVRQLRKVPANRGRPVSANLERSRLSVASSMPLSSKVKQAPTNLIFATPPRCHPVWRLWPVTRAAMRARKLPKVEWDTEPASSDDSEQIAEPPRRQRGREQAKRLAVLAMPIRHCYMLRRTRGRFTARTLCLTLSQSRKAVWRGSRHSPLKSGRPVKPSAVEQLLPACSRSRPRL